MTPYYDHAGITILHGDCRELLPRLDVARACITDPTYEQTSYEWDRWVDGWPALLTCSTLWCFSTLRMLLDRRDDFGGWKLAQDLVWEKNKISSPNNDRFLRAHELVTHWYRGAWGEQLQQVPARKTAAPRKVKAASAAEHWGDFGPSDVTVYDGGRLARSVQRFNSVRLGEHPTPKPVGLIRLLIEYSTKPGDIVIDPFCGGGPVLVAAKQLGRRAIGIDINERWCEASARRVGQELELAESCAP